jgi:hypothetical protein
MKARGVGCPIERETVTPCEDILLSPPKDRYGLWIGS